MELKPDAGTLSIERGTVTVWPALPLMDGKVTVICADASETMKTRNNDRKANSFSTCFCMCVESVL